MLIAIEGCFGAGKTTVASGLATCRERLLLLENFGANHNYDHLDAQSDNSLTGAITKIQPPTSTTAIGKLACTTSARTSH
jgi:broad-specificity NMP kinase